MKRNNVALLALFVLASTISSYSQSISKEEYYSAVRKAVDVEDLLLRRIIVRSYDLKSGERVLSKEMILEYDGPEKFRFVTKTITNGETRTTEEIRIGNEFFCRKIPEAWTKSENWCPYGDGLGGGREATKEEFTKETTGGGKDRVDLYRYYLTYNDYMDAKKSWFQESRIWIDAEARRTRSESKVGVVGEKTASSATIIEYQYEPMTTKIKIEAPIP
jgi:hypothetical protein